MSVARVAFCSLPPPSERLREIKSQLRCCLVDTVRELAHSRTTSHTHTYTQRELTPKWSPNKKENPQLNCRKRHESEQIFQPTAHQYLPPGGWGASKRDLCFRSPQTLPLPLSRGFDLVPRKGTIDIGKISSIVIAHHRLGQHQPGISCALSDTTTPPRSPALSCSLPPSPSLFLSRQAVYEVLIYWSVGKIKSSCDLANLLSERSISRSGRDAARPSCGKSSVLYMSVCMCVCACSKKSHISHIELRAPGRSGLNC